MHSRVSWDSRSDGELPGGYDVFLLANLIHYWSAEQNQELLQAVLMAGEFAVHLRTGDVDSVDEARGWLDRTGWRFVDHRPPAGPQSLIVAEAA